MTETFSVLVACDLRYVSDPLGQLWINSLVSTLSQRGWTVYFLAREVAEAEGFSQISDYGGTLVLEDGIPENQVKEGAHLPRLFARSVIRQASVLKADLVITQGLELSRYVAGSGMVSQKLWSLPLDAPYKSVPILPTDYSDLSKLTNSSARILVVSEEQRSLLEAQFPEATSKVRVLPVMGLNGPDETEDGDSLSSLEHGGGLPAQTSEIQDIRGPGDLSAVPGLQVWPSLFSRGDFPELERLGEVLRTERRIPRVHIYEFAGAGGTSSAGSTDASTVIDAWPGAEQTQKTDAADLFLLPGTDRLARHYGQLLAQINQQRTAQLALDSSRSGPIRQDEFAAGWNQSPDPFDEVAQSSVGAERRRPVRMVIAGSDFKFAGDLIETFVSDPEFDVRFDVFATHSAAQPVKSEPYLEWADVIFTEFAVQNAIWYSQNVSPDQTLIVHLHGYELLSDWIEQLDIDRVTAIVVASEFYRNKAHELRGWPLEKIKVVPNSVNPFDFTRPKLPDARFHLGLVGMVPILKRPDRALDLLESLLEVDSRYTLNIRGHAPWNYTWEWKKAAHQDAYRDFYQRLGQRPELARSVAFEPFGPDMANWLRKIGWLLSPSTRETFHLAAIEGATSGAIPLAWERDGAREIIGDDWTFSDLSEIRDFILAANSSEADYDLLSTKARESVGSYRSDVVGNLWKKTVLSIVEENTSSADELAPRGRAGQVYREIDALVKSGDFDNAKGALERHSQIVLSSTGMLKNQASFVRGLLELDKRRFGLLSHFSPIDHPGKSGYVKISTLGWESGFFFTPNSLTSSIGVRPYPYTAEHSEARSAVTEVWSARTRDGANFSGFLATDVLEPYLDSGVMVSEGLRFDRWVEFVAAELRATLSSHENATVVIDGPWHIALPAALAAHRKGMPYIWAVPAHEREILEKFSQDIYTEDVIVQFIGEIASRAESLMIGPGSEDLPRPHSLTSVVVPLRTVEGFTSDQSQLHVVDLDVLARVEEAGAPASVAMEDVAVGTHAEAGSSVSAERSDSLLPAKLAVAVLGNRKFVAGWKAQNSSFDVVEIKTLEDVNPAIDALVVDSSTLSLRAEQVPGKGNLAQRVRALFDSARISGTLGIFNSNNGVAWRNEGLSIAEKADAVTGASNFLIKSLLERNPNSITRVGSGDLSSHDPKQLRGTLASVGLSVPALTATGTSLEKNPESNLASEPELSERIDRLDPEELKALQLDPEDGISAVMATRLGAERLPIMLASLSAQSLDHSRMELVVVHNGPEDGSREVVESFRRENPRLETRFVHIDVESASAARNTGIGLAERRYVTFIDDDDELEPHYMLNMWLSADESLVVSAPLRDVSPDGRSTTDLANNRRLASLKGKRTPMNRVSGFLGMNACKLIPTKVAKEMHYPEELRSGEDVVFMSQLLFHDLELIPANALVDSAYVRHLRPDSVSRQLLTREFAVRDRMAVIRHLEGLRELAPSGVANGYRALERDQVSFIARYIEQNPQEAEEIVAELLDTGFGMGELKTRYVKLHAIAERVIQNREAAEKELESVDADQRV